MRCSYVLNNSFALLPEMLAWLGQELGRTEADAPDAWCALRESYLSTFYYNRNTVKNFERWLYQRDQVGYETKPAMQIPHGHSMWMVDPNRRFDYIARKGKKMGFDVDDAIFPAGAQPMAVKVSYHDAVSGTLTLKYEDATGVKTKSITTTGQDMIKTATFFITAKTSNTSLDYGFDLILESAEEIPVCFTRVIKTQGTYYVTAISGPQMHKDSSEVLALYPNPTDKLLNIDFDNSAERTVKIFNMNGQLIYTTQINKQSTQINIQQLNIRGIILIQVQSERAVTTHKILVK